MAWAQNASTKSAPRTINPCRIDGCPESIQETALQNFSRPLELRLPSDLGESLGQAITQALQRVASHVRALVAGTSDSWNGMIAVLWRFALELPHHVGFRGHQEIGRELEPSNVANHCLRPANEIAVFPDIRGAFRVCDREGLRQPALQREQIADAENFVDNAGAIPQNHFTPRDLFQILTEMAVRHEQNLNLCWHAPHDGFCVAGGHDPVRECFDRSRAIDVGDGLKPSALAPQHLL